MEYTHVISNSVIERVTSPTPLSSLWLLVSSLWKQYSLLLKLLPALLVLQVMRGERGQKSVGVGQPREGGAGHQESEEVFLLGVCKV